MKRTTLLPIAIVATCALGLGACGDGTSMEQSTVSVVASAEFNDADVDFVQMMLPHHEQALVLSDLALDPERGASQVIVDLATKIKAAQAPEIELMSSLLDAWGKERDEHALHMAGDDMGMLSDDQIDELSTLSGAEFDSAWAGAMLGHHLGAVAMAEDVLANGANLQVNDLARAIIAAQNAEIALLEPLA